MEQLTAGKVLEIWLLTLVKYWPIILFVIATVVGSIKYLIRRSNQQQQNINVLKAISESTHSMDTSLKEMQISMVQMNYDVKELRKDHNQLADKHKDLEKTVDYIRRGKE